MSNTTNDDQQLSVYEAEHLFLSEDLIRPEYSLYRIDGGDVRWYYCPDDDTHYPSVTSVIGSTSPPAKPLMDWIKRHGENADKMRDERAAYGTQLHSLVETLLMSGEVTNRDIGDAQEAYMDECASFTDIKRDLRKDLLAFENFAQEVSLEPIAIEIMLRGDGYAGAADIVGYVKGKLSIVDIKSGRHGFYKAHEVQLHMYKMAWELLYPERPIEKVYNWSPKAWRTKPTYNLKDQSKNDNGPLIRNMLERFALDGHKPPTLLDFTGSVTRGGDLGKMYQFTDMKTKVSEG